MEGKARGSAATVHLARVLSAREGRRGLGWQGAVCTGWCGVAGSAGLEANGKVMDGSAPLGFAG